MGLKKRMNIHLYTELCKFVGRELLETRVHAKTRQEEGFTQFLTHKYRPLRRQLFEDCLTKRNSCEKYLPEKC